MNVDTRLRDTEAFLHRQIPLTRAMQVHVESYDEKNLILSAPLAANHNHLGTAFGGSLAAMAMLAGYSLLWLELGDREAHLVVSECAMNFRRPVRETIRARGVRPNESVCARFRSDFAAKGKARLEIEVVIEHAGEIAVTFRGVYVARRRATPHGFEP